VQNVLSLGIKAQQIKQVNYRQQDDAACEKVLNSQTSCQVIKPGLSDFVLMQQRESAVASELVQDVMKAAKNLFKFIVVLIADFISAAEAERKTQI
jgi:hypothetical protein